LELVPAKKLPRGKKALKSEVAFQKYCSKIEFKPWKKRDKDLEAFGENWNSRIDVSVRVAMR
jgi:hypothetical protein